MQLLQVAEINLTDQLALTLSNVVLAIVRPESIYTHTPLDK